MTTAIDLAALRLGVRDPQQRREWLALAATECERRARRGGEHAELLARAAAHARARLAPTPEDL